MDSNGSCLRTRKPVTSESSLRIELISAAVGSAPEAATRGFCKEFARQHDVTVEFTDQNVPTRLHKDVSLCLFRITQEALHNAVKYSGTKHFAVRVRGTGTEVQLVVSDAGAGFNVEEAKKNGLGLISMQERVHLVHGQLHVESQLGAGTKIVVTVPLVAAVELPPDTDGDQPATVRGVA